MEVTHREIFRFTEEVKEQLTNENPGLINDVLSARRTAEVEHDKIMHQNLNGEIGSAKDAIQKSHESQVKLLKDMFDPSSRIGKKLLEKAPKTAE